jgi:hypothetical protein
MCVNMVRMVNMTKKLQRQIKMRNADLFVNFDNFIDYTVCHHWTNDGASDAILAKKRWSHKGNLAELLGYA